MQDYPKVMGKSWSGSIRLINWTWHIRESTIGSTTDDGAKLKVPRPKSAKQEPNADRRFKKTSPQPCWPINACLLRDNGYVIYVLTRPAWDLKQKQGK